MSIKSFFKFRREDFFKKSFLYFILALVFIVTVLGALAFYPFCVFRATVEPESIPTAKNRAEKALETMGSPDGKEVNVSEDILESLGEANEKAPEVSDDILNSLGSTPK